MMDPALRHELLLATQAGRLPAEIAKLLKCSVADVRQGWIEMETIGLRCDGSQQHVTSEQAAWVLNVIPRRVRGFCEDGRLGQRLGGRYLISVEDLLRFAAIPRPPGGAGVNVLAALAEQQNGRKVSDDGKDSDDRVRRRRRGGVPADQADDAKTGGGTKRARVSGSRGAKG